MLPKITQEMIDGLHVGLNTIPEAFVCMVSDETDLTNAKMYLNGIMTAQQDAGTRENTDTFNSDVSYEKLQERTIVNYINRFGKNGRLELENGPAWVFFDSDNNGYTDRADALILDGDKITVVWNGERGESTEPLSDDPDGGNIQETGFYDYLIEHLEDEFGEIEEDDSNIESSIVLTKKQLDIISDIFRDFKDYNRNDDLKIKHAMEIEDSLVRQTKGLYEPDTTYYSKINEK